LLLQFAIASIRSGDDAWRNNGGLMPINWNAHDREEDQLVRQVNSGEISQKEFDRAMRDMRDEIRAYAEEEAERAYNEAMGHW
jgi:hypothetical protein